MNSLCQDSSLLVANTEAIFELSQKREARLLVVSDSHGAYASLIAILRRFGKTSDALVFCGDGIADIARLIENAHENTSLRDCIPPVVGIVEGNNDADLYPVRNVKGDEPYYVELKVPVFNVLEAASHRVFFTHGHRHSLYYGTEQLIESAIEHKADVALYGHTHIACETFGKVYAMNPGSCYRPRVGQKPSFATLDLVKGKRIYSSCFWALSAAAFTPFTPYSGF